VSLTHSPVVDSLSSEKEITHLINVVCHDHSGCKVGHQEAHESTTTSQLEYRCCVKQGTIGEDKG